MPYQRGSAAVAKIMVESLFRLAYLEVTDWNTDPDCEALIEPSSDNYQTNYRSFFSKVPFATDGIMLSNDKAVEHVPKECFGNENNVTR
jgi:hypothetical protein